MRIQLCPAWILLAGISLAWSADAAPQLATPDAEYADAIRRSGVEPVEFMLRALDDHDLLIFDDALHSAKEPFDFYQRLLRDARFQKRVKSVFVEVFSIAAQPAIDAYLESPTGDRMLLAKVFQDDFSGFGWRYETYLDLLAAVRDVNRGLPPDGRIRVIGVDQPIYWEAIHTRQDYDIFQESLIARDYFMYKTIQNRLDGFEKGAKAIFLTNTRHSYKQLRNREGGLFWNCATFFDQNFPGKACSIRIHNVSLDVLAAKEVTGSTSTEGMEKMEFRWVRVANGAWDRAFAQCGSKPVAVPLRDNAFGRTKYVGNLVLGARPDQTMFDAYDAVVFLAPLEQLRFSAGMDFFYTPAFKQELKRRITLLEGDHLPQFLRDDGAETLDAFIEQFTKYQPEQRNSLVESAGS